MSITPEEQVALIPLLEEFLTNIPLFAVSMFGEANTLRPKQIEFAEAFRLNKRITFKGGVGFGKTRVLAVIVWWALIVVGSLKGDTKVTIFGPTDATLKTGLANEIKSLYDKMPEPFREAFTVTAEKIERKTRGADCQAHFRTVNKENPSANSGIHATNNFIIVDEATGVDEVVYTQALLGHLTSDVNPKIALIANPRVTSGFFYRTWNDPAINEQWVKVHGKMSDNPRVTQADIDAAAKTYGGITTREYRYTVEGEFPLDEEDGLIGRALVENAINNPYPVPAETLPIIWGVDPAGPGKDRSVLIKRHDNTIIETPREWRGLNTTQSAYKIRDLYQETPNHLKPAVIAVDGNGLGHGLAANLKDWGLPVKDVKTQSSPTRKAELYSRLRDQLWWEMREWFQTENVRIPNHANLIEELCTPTYRYETNGRIKVESKDDIKKRLRASPDFADALSLTFAVSPTRYASKYSWSQDIDYGDLRWAE